jgi:hypothetical protein
MCLSLEPEHLKSLDHRDVMLLRFPLYLCSKLLQFQIVYVSLATVLGWIPECVNFYQWVKFSFFSSYWFYFNRVQAWQKKSKVWCTAFYYTQCLLIVLLFICICTGSCGTVYHALWYGSVCSAVPLLVLYLCLLFVNSFIICVACYCRMWVWKFSPGRNIQMKWYRPFDKR